MNKVELMEHLRTASHYELCRIWRYAASSSPYIQIPAAQELLRQRLFDEYGGFTPEIGRQLGWNDQDVFSEPLED